MRRGKRRLTAGGKKMTKENWTKHIESLSGLVRPSLSGDKVAWREFVLGHKTGCKDCAGRAKTKRASMYRSMKDQAMKDLGLTKVYGAVSGKVYWE